MNSETFPLRITVSLIQHNSTIIESFSGSLYHTYSITIHLYVSSRKQHSLYPESFTSIKWFQFKDSENSVCINTISVSKCPIHLQSSFTSTCRRSIPHHAIVVPVFGPLLRAFKIFMLSEKEQPGPARAWGMLVLNFWPERTSGWGTFI